MSKSRVIRIGAYPDQLSKAMAAEVAGLIKPSGYHTEIISVKPGDSRKKIIDIFVLRAEDTSLFLDESLELISLTRRSIVHDAVLGHNGKSDLLRGNARVGTSSLRSRAFIRHLYPKIQVKEKPENLPTGIAILKNGNLDAFITSAADAKLLGLDHFITEKIETSYVVPAVGQGSIAVICHKKLGFGKKDVIQNWVNHADTEDCIRTERSFLINLPMPLHPYAFGYARLEGNLITLKAGVISADGQQLIKIKRSGMRDEGKELGKKTAAEVLQHGAEEILMEVKR